jgi:glycosyltransferase involved in cell wall biosynthesis
MRRRERGRPLIAIISPNPTSRVGGVERFCHTLADTVRSHGWRAALVGPTVRPRERLGRLGLHPLMLSRSAMRAATALRADVVVTNGFLGGPGDASRVHVYHGTLPTHAIHGAPRPSLFTARLAVSGGLAEAWAGRGAVRVAVSDTAAAEVRRLYRMHVEHVVPNGIDTQLFAPGDRGQARDALGLDDRAMYALFVGRPEYRKGADLTPAAASAGFTLLSAGSQPPAGARPLGVLSETQMALAYRAVDCVLFPTRYEACSFVVLEALATGVPLITTNTGWMRSFLASNPAYMRYIVQPNEADIVRGLREAVGSDTTEFRRIARDAVVAQCGLATFHERWLGILERIVRAKA